MNKLLLTFFLLLQFFMSKAQTGVYKTYEDYVSGHIIPMKKVDHISTPRLAKMMITFVDSMDNKITFMGDQVWGCIIKGQLFRGDLKGFMAVVDTGKVCYYQNGIVYLRKVTGIPVSVVEDDIFSVSAGLNGKCYNSYEKFFKENPTGFSRLYYCLKDISTLPRVVSIYPKELDYTAVNKAVRRCIADYNASQ